MLTAGVLTAQRVGNRLQRRVTKRRYVLLRGRTAAALPIKLRKQQGRCAAQ